MLVRFSDDVTRKLKSAGATDSLLNEFAAGVVDYPHKSQNIDYCDSAECLGVPVAWIRSHEKDISLILKRKEGKKTNRKIKRN